PYLAPYYELAGAHRTFSLDDFVDAQDFSHEAGDLLERTESIEQLLQITFAGANIGRIAASSALRQLRQGSLDLESTPIRQQLQTRLAVSMTCAVAYQKMLADVSPNCAIFPDMVYGRRGELFDNCLHQNIDAIVWRPSHKSNAIILKRYTAVTRDDDPVSLSDNSWSILKNMRWLPSHREALRNELCSVYANSDWFSEWGTQFDKRILTRHELQTLLGLDPAKKTAVIFPHIVWDASMSRGKDLFADYQEWLVQTVSAGCANKKVDLGIKTHSADVGKSLKDGYQGEPAEEIVLREQIGELPAHVFLIKAQTDISTYSLLELMDYCVTVRGTTGIEAARRGIP